MRRRLIRQPPWPLPALLGWLLAWAVFGAARRGGMAPAPAFVAAALAGAALAACTHGRWRRTLVAAGFPASACALGALGAVPAWAWLAVAAPLLLAYPVRAWRDAPFFPTPHGALSGLPAAVQLPADARVLDAGCGLGHGLQALRRAWPGARCTGVEWSRPLAWAAARRCRFATVQRGDMWATPWAEFDLVYVFQRPDSMARVMAKAQAEMAPGSWLVSLEFAVPGTPPTARAGTPGGRPVWVYRVTAAERRAAAAQAVQRSTTGPGRR